MTKVIIKIIDNKIFFRISLSLHSQIGRFMIQKFLITTFLLVTMGIFNGCNSDNSDSISTDIIHNPNTASGKSDLSVLPVFSFTEVSHDFGKIIEGESVSFDFKFSNSGKTDLVISDVTTSCGCTVPEFSKEPIRPGKEGSVKVTFASAGRRGNQNKTIVVLANTQPNTTMLKIKAQVVSPGSEK